MTGAIKPAVSGLLLTLFVVLPFAANADLPGRHPAYLHALTDLRTARWMLEHRPEDPAVSGREEESSITEIDAAISDIVHAAIDDGKNIHDHAAADVPADRLGRLHKALELLRKARHDAAREEDDPSTRGLRARSVRHIEAAIHATEHTIHDVDAGR